MQNIRAPVASNLRNFPAYELPLVQNRESSVAKIACSTVNTLMLHTNQPKRKGFKWIKLLAHKDIISSTHSVMPVMHGLIDRKWITHRRLHWWAKTCKKSPPECKLETRKLHSRQNEVTTMILPQKFSSVMSMKILGEPCNHLRGRYMRRWCFWTGVQWFFSSWSKFIVVYIL